MSTTTQPVSRSDAYREAWTRDLDPSTVGEVNRGRFVAGADHAVSGGELKHACNAWFAAGYHWAHREAAEPPTG